MEHKEQDKSLTNDKTDGDVVHGHKVSGDMVAGDQYTVDIKDSEAVAIGAGARAEINHYTEIIVKLDTIEDLPPASGEPPYKGLAYFTEKDAKIYYGRKSLSKHISTRLSQQHFLALIGASGSGKSSLLRAGVIPRLREQNWLIHVITPGIHPLSALTNVLARDVNSLDFAPKLEKMMRQKAETLHLIGNKFASRADAPRLLIAVDQFEEVFTQCHDEVERRAFVENLLTAANKGGSVTILIGLRADFYDRCAHFEGLRELVSQQQEFIGPMNQQELVRVIAEPAKQGGWQFVEGLVEQIIEDAGQEPGRLPLLSHALRETWERRRGVAMTLAGYRAAGGVEGAIAKTAEEVLGRFDEGETAVAQSIFLSLTELGEGAEDTRRIASLTELEESNADKPLDAVLQMLINARLITTGEGQVEVAHEALIRRWPRLRIWLDANREYLRFERKLTQDAKEWKEADENEGYLYSEPRVKQAITLVEKGKITLQKLNGRFLVASREEAEREAREKEAQRQNELQMAQELASSQSKAARRLRFGIVAVLGVLFVAVVTAVYAIGQQQEAEQQTAIANARYLIGEGQTIYESNPLQGLALVAEGVKLLEEDEEDEEYQEALRNDSYERVFQKGGLFAFENVDGLYGAHEPIFGHFNFGSVFTTTEWFIVDYDRDNFGEMRQWRADSTIIPLSKDVWNVIYSPNSEWIVVGYENASAEMWQLGTKNKIPLNGNIRDAFSDRVVSQEPDGDWLVINYQNRQGEMRQWGSTETITLTGNIFVVEIAPNNKWLAISYWDSQTEIRKWGTTEVISFTEEVRAVDFSPDGMWFVVEYHDTYGEMQQLESTRVITLNGIVGQYHDSGYFSRGIHSSPDGEWLAIDYLYANDEMRQWGSMNSIPLNGDIGNVSHDPNGEWLLVDYVDASDEMRRWGSTDVITLAGEVKNVDIDPLGDWLVIWYENGPGEMRRWGSSNAVTLNGSISGVHLSPNREWLAVNYENGDAEIRQWGSTKSIALNEAIDFEYEFAGGPRGIFSLPDGKWFVVDYLNANGVMRQWESNVSIALNGEIGDVWHDPSGDWLVVTYENGSTELWDLKRRQYLSNLENGARRVSFATDKAWVLVDFGTQIKMYDMNWLQFISEDGNEAGMNELVVHACEELLSDPDFDPTTLKPSYFNAMPNNRPQACPSLYDRFFQ